MYDSQVTLSVTRSFLSNQMTFVLHSAITLCTAHILTRF